MTTSWPAACNACASRSEEAAMPPRSGCAGEMRMIFCADKRDEFCAKVAVQPMISV